MVSWVVPLPDTVPPPILLAESCPLLSDSTVVMVSPALVASASAIVIPLTAAIVPRAATIWDVTAGKVAAVVSPEGKGVERFAVTRDGKKLVAFVGVMEKDIVAPGKIAVYDVCAVVKP